MPVVVRRKPAILLVLALSRCRSEPEVPEARAEYVGRESCARCHERATELHSGSHHDLAMEEANRETVLGDFSGAKFRYGDVTSTFFEREGKFFVETDGPDGGLREYEIAYTFGVTPLQQYLIPFPGGRYQALSIAWDARPEEEGGRRWFHLYPNERVDYEDPLHWTKRHQNWNLMCAECHSTALAKNYDLEKNAYETRWSEIDVSCEACHGPASLHLAWAERPEGERGAANGLTVDLSDNDGGTWVMNMETGLSKRVPPRSSRVEVETCARCHARRSAQQADYVHGRPLLDTHRPSLLDPSLYFPDGQIEDEVYEYGSFLQSKMYREGVTCKDCHDSHRLQVRGQGNSVCAACHLPEKFDARSHHFHRPGGPGSVCIDCHMPSRTYMVVDPRRDHSFRIPRPDLTLATGSPNACNGCHKDRAAGWANEVWTRWYGEPAEPHYGVALDAGRRGLPGAGAALERVASDRSLPGIARATALSLLSTAPASGSSAVLSMGLSDPDPLVRLGAVEGAVALEPSLRHSSLIPLLRDQVLSVRIEAARALSELPPELFTKEQRASLERGADEYTKAQLANADWPESHMNLGLLHLSRDELSQGSTSYQTAVKLDAQFSRAYVNLADLRRMEGKDAEAEALLRRGLEILPEDAELHHALGLALVRLSRKGEAIAELGRAFELRPEEARYGYVFGVALDGEGERARALEVLAETNERHPFDRDVLFALAAFHREAGAREKAREYARKLVEAAPGDPAAIQLLRELEGVTR
jgi:tetratricopeptide (TPR) repeat protein/nitrate/TMAO reductase-like tetraheme cytochrome c subunit